MSGQEGVFRLSVVFPYPLKMIWTDDQSTCFWHLDFLSELVIILFFLLFIIILLSVCFHLQTSEYAFSLMKPEGFIYNDEVKVSIT
jgi:hypothetical protein